MNERHYNSYRQYIKQKFGTQVFKIPLSAGFSCPNRDGKKSFTGCTFCDNRSFSPAALRIESPVDQLQAVIRAVSHKYSAFIPYLQPFSNTYGSVDVLRKVYEPLLKTDGVVGLAIGTRPDCFSSDVYNYLSDINSRTYLSIELGLQSVHDSTLQQCNRGHTFKDFTDSLECLTSKNIETVAHVMLGLPGETPEMMLETAQKLSELPVRGVKIHQVMVIRDTEIEKMYSCHQVVPFVLESYAELLCTFLEYLRPDQLIHRIMADSKPEFGLIAPEWSAEKSKSISAIHRIMQQRNCVQGKRSKRD